MKHAIVAMVLAVLTLPVAALATFLLTPLWRWVEDAFKIESIGHSGPASWCFVAIYFSLLLPGSLVWILSARRRRESGKNTFSNAS